MENIMNYIKNRYKTIYANAADALPKIPPNISTLDNLITEYNVKYSVYKKDLDIYNFNATSKIQDEFSSNITQQNISAQNIGIATSILNTIYNTIETDLPTPTKPQSTISPPPAMSNTLNNSVGLSNEVTSIITKFNRIDTGNQNKQIFPDFFNKIKLIFNY
jgi:hypothetical protein